MHSAVFMLKLVNDNDERGSAYPALNGGDIYDALESEGTGVDYVEEVPLDEAKEMMEAFFNNFEASDIMRDGENDRRFSLKVGAAKKCVVAHLKKLKDYVNRMTEEDYMNRLNGFELRMLAIDDSCYVCMVDESFLMNFGDFCRRLTDWEHREQGKPVTLEFVKVFDFHM